MDAQDTTLFLTGIELLDSRMGPAAPTIPAAPTGLVVTDGSSSLTLDWTNGDTYSLIAIDKQTGTGDFLALTTVAGNVITYEDTAVVADTTYTYKVRGLKATFPSPYSNTDSGAIVPVVLDAPSSLTDDTGMGSSTPSLSWTNNGPGMSGDYDSIKIEEKVGAGAFSEIDSITGATNTWDHADPPLAPGLYSYRVRGKVGTDFSPYSNTVVMTLPHS